MPFMFEHFIQIDLAAALQVVLLGFIGGTLSGFIGSGGAFFMTPGMMNLGVPGVVAVGSNITHKFGKAMMGAKKHLELGNVDRRLGAFLVLTSFIGIRLAVWINSKLFEGGVDSHGVDSGAASDLYISAVFIGLLTIVSLSMLRDSLRSRESSEKSAGPSMKIANFIGQLHIPPYIRFKEADVRVSLWIILVVGLITGYMAGTIGVGGFVGVPAMIYVIGIPTAVAAGTELFLAMFMGAYGAIDYAFQGFVDIRLTLLLYLGSLIGIYIGAYGTKVVKEVIIRIVTGAIIILCVISRAVAVPMYMRQLGWIGMNPEWDIYFNQASKAMLIIAGLSGVGIILFNVFKAYRRRSKIHATLKAAREAI
jgi:uncharacterized membrane protein YfcA